jgi:hypothetical protein
MSPEFGFALLLTLLWGPTALWLVSRMIRGQRGRPAGSFNREAETELVSGVVPQQPEALASEGFWVCAACHSMNRRGAKRCYSCHKEIHSDGRLAPGELHTARDLVPVMAEGMAGTTGTAVMATLAVPAAATGAVPGSTVAVPAAATGEPAVATLVREPAVAVVPAPTYPARNAGRTPAVAPLGILATDPVCPFLGFSEDPTTRCSFPDPRNRCHTPPQHGHEGAAFPLRLITGKAGTMRTLEIGPEHQETLCLTAAHEQCARFPAVRVVAGRR